MKTITPGPWVWEEHSRKSADGGGDMPCLYGADGSQVCNFGDGEQYYPTAGDPPSDADMRLIAEAPAMLECLQNIKASLSGSDYRAERVADALRRVNAMLARFEEVAS